MFWISFVGALVVLWLADLVVNRTKWNALCDYLFYAFAGVLLPFGLVGVSTGHYVGGTIMLAIGGAIVWLAVANWRHGRYLEKKHQQFASPGPIGPTEL